MNRKGFAIGKMGSLILVLIVVIIIIILIRKITTLKDIFLRIIGG